ncbi:MAG: cell division protein FtsB [Gammaproteobacteria bacterium]|nr:cell division protein FtsB [Gammaproteobacteria bacterium]NNJ92788.1 cell division protein FtsB [Gammaproteobacteria bacterium]
MRFLLALLLLIFLALQYRLWVGEGSYAEVRHLQQEIANRKADLKRMEKENQELRAEIEDLKKGLEAIQERARSELGMIKEGETYFQIVEPQPLKDD